MKTFYVCSYGGSGSWALAMALTKFGKIRHIHSRNPPQQLTYTGKLGGGNAGHEEWFNNIKIPDNEIENYYVIYIYRDPIKAIFSRFYMQDHLKHLQLNSNIKLRDVVKYKKDFYKLKQFYNNYTCKNIKRNYKIYCIKYEELFDKQMELSKLLGIGPLNLVKKETKRVYKKERELRVIYKDMLDDMKNNEFVEIR